MDANNLFVSQALGIVILTMSLGFAIQPQHYKTAFHELMSQPGLKFIVSVIPLILGTLLVLTHQRWDDRWDIFVGVLLCHPRAGGDPSITHEVRCCIDNGFPPARERHNLRTEVVVNLI